LKTKNILSRVVSSALSILLATTYALSISTLIPSEAVAQPTERPNPRPGLLLYRVHPKDHLAEILRSMGFQDLWGAKGMVARTIRTNDLQNPNELESGSWLFVPASKLPEASTFEVAGGEIVKGGGKKSVITEPRPPVQSAPGRGPLPAREQTVQVQCSDQSIHEAHVRLVLPQAPDQSALLIVLDKEGICAPALQTAAPVVPIEPSPSPIPLPSVAPIVAGEPTMATEQKTSDRSSTNKLEELHPVNAIASPESRDISRLPFVLAPMVGYIGDSLQFGGAGSSPNTGGLSYGARLGYVYRRADWGYLVDLAFRQAQLTTTEATADFLTMSMLEYGLGVSFRHWTVRAGFANNSLTDASATNNVSFADKGYYGSLAYSFFFNARISASIEGRYTGVTYLKSNNFAFTNDVTATQLETIFSFDYRFGLW
jgi:hypothetical protein